MNILRRSHAWLATTVLIVAGGVLASATCTAQVDDFLGDHGMPYAAFDRLPHQLIEIDGSTLTVGFAPGKFALSSAQMLGWIRQSAGIVAAFYGHFPVAASRILIVPVDGRGVRGGTTWGYRGAAIRLLVGRDSRMDDISGDWKIVHEMTHLALPDLDESHNWFSEGLATYLEPIERAQAGDLSAASIWSDMARDMAKGLPRGTDSGLDGGHSWARTYWGGALFCLVADVEIRRQSHDRLGLQDAMRGALDAGANHERHWTIERVLALADRATGTEVLSRQYAAWAHAPVHPDLDALWRELGIVRNSDGSVTFDDAAKFAAIRIAITRAPARVADRKT